MNLSGKIHKAFNDITDKMKFHIPFTGSYNVWKRLRGSKSILDVGCGTGVAMLSLNRDHCFNYTIGVDGHYPYLKSCRLNNTHTDFVLADIRHLPLIPRSFDSVICLEVLEHLEKKDGYEFLQSLERIARQGVILALPIGHYGQHAFDGNPYQEHRSQWEPQCGDLAIIR